MLENGDKALHQPLKPPLTQGSLLASKLKQVLL